MAGYSGTPLAQKLGIKPGHRVALLGAPADFESWLDGLDDSFKISRRLAAACDVIVFFPKGEPDLRRRFDAIANSLTPAGGFWIAWPKRSSGVPTDLTEDIIRAIGLEAGLVDNKVCAVSDVYSGLRFVVRLKDRPGRLTP